ncbi:uncharacterized protein SPAPADRAFT_61170 [Spathaspora passalidarum NRRL Y-27907]|uniref:Uncharacterized protein n=1 Tax=Spathaspora passalidarum (strain NRRL Y-27907 / 11-Y1) TaxID=619300 RepID=G3APB2_SPAPN|nr:uncharacterized protein SPAPADRAFT_61170 [Spathaspora passalidarum NRRL Y-27907]EGW32089.1 hypothetical protein SPAPADRAFT_61170 [Spathaspora passalidarum NRRL Y-27907]
MFGLLSKRTGFRAASVAVQSVRTFVPLKGAKPTVFEPLPKKRNGENAMAYLHKQLLKKHDPTGQRTNLINTLRAGDIIRVTYMDRSDVSGRIIAIKRGQYNLGGNILIRTKVGRIASELRIPVFNPNIRFIELVEKPKQYLPRNKHYYVRESSNDVNDVEAYLKNKRSEEVKQTQTHKTK